jgi:hypothetical protein
LKLHTNPCEAQSASSVQASLTVWQRYDGTSPLQMDPGATLGEQYRQGPQSASTTHLLPVAQLFGAVGLAAVRHTQGTPPVQSASMLHSS